MNRQPQKIQIDEENIQFFWGLIAVVSIAMATYMIINAFMAQSWATADYSQLIALALFSIGFYGIIRISSPLFHFVLKISDATLIIEIWSEGDKPVGIQRVELDQIDELRITPHTPRSKKDALFDFSTNYHLLYRDIHSEKFKRLIDLEGKFFTLKVDDIRKIINFLTNHKSTIYVPEQDALFLT